MLPTLLSTRDLLANTKCKNDAADKYLNSNPRPGILSEDQHSHSFFTLSLGPSFVPQVGQQWPCSLPTVPPTIFVFIRLASVLQVQDSIVGRVPEEDSKAGPLGVCESAFFLGMMRCLVCHCLKIGLTCQARTLCPFSLFPLSLESPLSVFVCVCVSLSLSVGLACVMCAHMCVKGGFCVCVCVCVYVCVCARGGCAWVCVDVCV